MEPLLQVQNLKTYYFTANGIFKAVDDVSFTLRKQETFCLIGESGCGKSTTALSIMRMLGDQARIVGGKILFENEDFATLSKKELRRIWGKKIFIIFQDPTTSLNPVMKIKNQIKEVLIRKENKSLTNSEITERGIQLLSRVDIPDPKEVLEQFPHQMSGGMKQRVMIAMGICLNPNLLILDEPTTALDSTIQFRIIELILKLKEDHKMSQILITHDFGVAAKLSDQTAVMYAGKIVEQGKYIDLLKEPAHPYTQGLLNSLIKRNRKVTHLECMPGFLPSLSNTLQGCYFQDRCKISTPICKETQPKLIDLGNEHLVACHRLISE